MTTPRKTLKEIVEEYTKEDKWNPEVVAMAVVAKARRQAEKGEKIDDVIVLRHSPADEYKLFLQALAANVGNLEDRRFQMAVYVDDVHWVAVDVEIKNNELAFFIVDSIDNVRFQESVSSRIKKSFPTADIYQLKQLENSIQADARSCSRFTLHNIYALQKVDTFSVLSNLVNNGKIKKNKKNINELNLDVLPIEFIKLLRPDQYTERLETLPEYLQVAEAGKVKGDKNAYRQHGSLKQVMQSYSKTITKPEGKSKTHNTFIEYKKEKFISLIRNLMDSQNDDDIDFILRQSHGYGVIASHEKYKDFDPTPEKLYEAFYNGDIPVMFICFAKSMYVDTFDSAGQSALTIAIDDNDMDLLVGMLSADSRASIYRQNNEGQSALLVAVENKNLDTVNRLLKFDNEEDINRNEAILSALLAAVKDSHTNIFTALDNKYDVKFDVKYTGSISEFRGQSILSLAINTHNIPFMNLLLHTAIVKNDVSTVKQLLEHGAELSSTNNEMQNTIAVATKNNNTEILKLLLDRVKTQKNVDINSPDKDGMTALHHAAVNKNIDTAKLLLLNGANPDSANASNMTALHFAANTNNLDLIKLLLENNANPNLRNFRGMTALHFVMTYKKAPTIEKEILIKKNVLDIVELLLKNGANIDIEDAFGSTPLHYSVNSENPDVLNLLLANGNQKAKDRDGMTLLHWAAENPDLNIDVVNKILENNFEPNIKDKKGKTPLDYAKQKKNGHIFKELLIQALINKGTIPDSENNLLESIGVDINEMDNDETLLHYAARNGHTEIVEILLQNNVYINFPDGKMDSTALHIAAEQGHTDIVNLLLEHGASPFFQDRHGRTPLYLAQENGNLQIVSAISSVISEYNKELFIAIKSGDIDRATNLITDYLEINPDKNAIEALVNLDNLKPDLEKDNNYVDTLKYLINVQLEYLKEQSTNFLNTIEQLNSLERVSNHITNLSDLKNEAEVIDKEIAHEIKYHNQPNFDRIEPHINDYVKYINDLTTSPDYDLAPNNEQLQHAMMTFNKKEIYYLKDQYTVLLERIKAMKNISGAIPDILIAINEIEIKVSRNLFDVTEAENRNQPVTYHDLLKLEELFKESESAKLAFDDIAKSNVKDITKKHFLDLEKAFINLQKQINKAGSPEESNQLINESLKSVRLYIQVLSDTSFCENKLGMFGMKKMIGKLNELKDNEIKLQAKFGKYISKDTTTMGRSSIFHHDTKTDTEKEITTNQNNIIKKNPT